MNVTIEPRHEEWLHRPWHPEIQGWSQDITPFYAAMAEALPDGANILEIGVHHGRSILFLASLLFEAGKTKCLLVGIDPSVGPELQANLRAVEARCIVSVIPGWSAECALKPSHGPAFDLVFIDGGHDYQSVCEDILGYWDKVKSGGILAGHDFDNPEWPGVRQAVDRLLPFAQHFQSVFWVTR